MQETINWKIPSCFDSQSALLHPVAAKVRIPGSKSLTNRYLVLAALSEKPVVIEDALIARDTQLMIAALSALGCEITVTGTTIAVTPGELIGAQINAGLAGTVMRFIPPIAALAKGTTIIDGDVHARKRPMDEILNALRQLGVSTKKLGSPGDSLPIEITGSAFADFAVSGNDFVAPDFPTANLSQDCTANNKTMPVVKIDASRSSQFISALLLSAARYPQGIELHHEGPKLPSLPHIEMTLEVLHRAGVKAEHISVSPHIWRVFPGAIQQTDISVEADLTNAGPFLAAAMLTGGNVTIENWPVSKSTQPGLRYRDLFQEMGAKTELSEQGLTLQGPQTITALELDCAEIGELVPTLAAVAAFAKGTSRFVNIGHLRGHETDRLTALATELQKIGVKAQEEADALVVHGIGGDSANEADIRSKAEKTKIRLQAYADHRMATFAALIGLRIPELELDDIGATTKTFPSFAELWKEVAQ